MQSKILVYPFRPKVDLSGCVLVGGCFDIFHYGHLTFLKESAKLGPVIIALEGDQSIQNRKKNPPIHTQQQRAEILAELEVVQRVVLLPELKTYGDYLGLVQEIRPTILAITAGDPQAENKKTQAKTTGAQVVVVTTILDGLSSSLIKAVYL